RNKDPGEAQVEDRGRVLTHLPQHAPEHFRKAYLQTADVEGGKKEGQKQQGHDPKGHGRPYFLFPPPASVLLLQRKLRVFLHLFCIFHLFLLYLAASSPSLSG